MSFYPWPRDVTGYRAQEIRAAGRYCSCRLVTLRDSVVVASVSLPFPATTIMLFSTVALVVVATVTMVIALFITVLSTSVIVIVAVTRRVHISVPVVPYEIDWPAACLVAMAVSAPMFGVAGRYAQINRRWTMVMTLDHDRFCINQPRAWVVVADVDLPIKARLTDADRDANVGCQRRAGCEYDDCGEQEAFHK